MRGEFFSLRQLNESGAFMPKVTFLPMEKTVEAATGETLLDVALAHGIPIQHACGGFCACTTCHVVVEKGFELLEPMEEDESERTEYLDGKTPLSRLACQTKIAQDVTVRVVNIED